MVIPNTTQNGLVLTSLGNGTDASQWASINTLPPGTATGQMLWWNGSAWTPTATPGSGQYLLWNGTTWVATTPSSGSSVAPYTPAVNGLKAWTFDPAMGTTSFTAATVYYYSIYLQAGVTYSNIFYYGSSATTAGQFAVYNPSYARVATTNTFSFTSVGVRTVPLKTAYTPTTSDVYWIGAVITFGQVLFSAVSLPTFGPNYGTSSSTPSRAAVPFTAISTLPSTMSGPYTSASAVMLLGLT